MGKRLTDIFFDSAFSNYYIFVSNKKAVLVNIKTLKVTTLSEEEYLKGFKDNRVRI